MAVLFYVFTYYWRYAIIKKSSGILQLRKRKDIWDMASIAIITGATGGLGLEFVREVLKEKVDEIWTVARNTEKLDKLKKQFGDNVRAVKCDLSKADDLAALKELINAEKSDIRLLINNAGICLNNDTVLSTVCCHGHSAFLLGFNLLTPLTQMQFLFDCCDCCRCFDSYHHSSCV